ncbi:hypothetical protein [Paraburkholderia sp. RL17-337-BIB-A]|uniref:hypothetical protein n=1 Tax=Paraburkholderia sp. RL17-337-BIB-A TaxID=3031636 RepID=UPI0038B735F4
MVFELIEQLKRMDPHWSVCHLGPYDLREHADEVHAVETNLDAAGVVFLLTRLPPAVVGRMPKDRE